MLTAPLMPALNGPSPRPHLPLLGFDLVDLDGGDGVLGPRLHLPLHLPLGAPGPGLQQVHPLLGFHPAGQKGNEKKEGEG